VPTFENGLAATIESGVDIAAAAPPTLAVKRQQLSNRLDLERAIKGTPLP